MVGLLPLDTDLGALVAEEAPFSQGFASSFCLRIDDDFSFITPSRPGVLTVFLLDAILQNRKACLSFKRSTHLLLLIKTER